MRNRVREQHTVRELPLAEPGSPPGISWQTVIPVDSGRYLPPLPPALPIARFSDVPQDEVTGS